MAKVTKVEAVKELVEVEPEKFLVELTLDEKKGLQHLLGYGVEYQTNSKLGLDGLFEALTFDKPFGGL
jgi:hypothetical protein